MTNIQVLKETLSWIWRPINGAWTMCHYYSPFPVEPHLGVRVFCQNSGSCGSMYIVELLRANGVANCYHQKRPELDALGVEYYEGKRSEERLKRLLGRTRKKVYFEACNRLFSVSKLLKQVFPEAKFIHLHRDPREVVASALSKPSQATWSSGRRRYNCQKLCGPLDAPVLERACHYWSNYNQRILDDLSEEDFLSLKFVDLVAGRVDKLESFLQVDLSQRTILPVNANKPVRKEGMYQAFDRWPKKDQDRLIEICGPVMEQLGYGF